MKVIIFATLLFFYFIASAQAQVVISEVYPAPTSDENEWVELYNTSSDDADISGWKLFEHFSSKKELVLFENINIEANSFYIFELPSNKLNNSEEKISLEDLDNQEVSVLHYNNSESQKSFSYFFIDQNNISELLGINTPTKGVINQIIPVQSPTPVPSPTPTPTPQNSPVAAPSNAPETKTNITDKSKIEATIKPKPINYALEKHMSINQKLSLPKLERIEKEGLVKSLPRFSYIVQKSVSKQGVISAIIGGSMIIFIGFIL